MTPSEFLDQQILALAEDIGCLKEAKDRLAEINRKYRS